MLHISYMEHFKIKIKFSIVLAADSDYINIIGTKIIIGMELGKKIHLI